MPTYLPTLPYTPGGDVCGEVVEIGSDVSEFSIGDKGCVLNGDISSSEPQACKR